MGEINHTDERIKKMLARGLSPEQIARKIGRPDDIQRVVRVMGGIPSPPRLLTAEEFANDPALEENEDDES